MNTLSLQTKIELDTSYDEYKILELKDKTFILYSSSEMIHFSKNLKSEQLSCYDLFYITSLKQIKNGNILCCNYCLLIYSTKPKIEFIKFIKTPNFNKEERLIDTIVK